jgi:hypothetical protein
MTELYFMPFISLWILWLNCILCFLYRCWFYDWTVFYVFYIAVNFMTELYFMFLYRCGFYDWTVFYAFYIAVDFMMLLFVLN